MQMQSVTAQTLHDSDMTVKSAQKVKLKHGGASLSTYSEVRLEESSFEK